MTTTIQALKKVTLALIACNTGGETEKNNLTRSPVFFEFIYGVASDGLCPFEGALHDKCVGERLILTLDASETHEYFGHLFLQMRQVLGLQLMPESMTLEVEVTDVREADNREIVQSLAKALTSGGCGGSCGCGC